MCRCAVEGHGFVVDLAVLGSWLGSMILKIFQPECLHDSESKVLALQLCVVLL